MRPIFKSKRNLPFSILEPINRELLEILSVLSKVEYLDRAFLTVYVKKKITNYAFARIFQLV